MINFVKNITDTMKKGLFGLWSILATSLALFITISSFSPIRVGGVEIKDSGMSERLTRPVAQRPECLLDIADETAALLTSCKVAIEVDTTAKTILLVGDSMLEGLSPRLAAYAKENGHTLYTVIWYSSTSKIWSDAAKLTTYIKRYQPDYIFICLGANELFVKDIKSKRDHCVKSIIKEIGDIPYVWIGPPNWKEDTGINQLISTYAGKGHYFKSAGMTFERAKDGAHPTRQSASLWMDSVVNWMYSNSAHPIKLDAPAIKQARPKKVIVLQPKH